MRLASATAGKTFMASVRKPLMPLRWGAQTPSSPHSRNVVNGSLKSVYSSIHG
jgi:hypothetical protein